MGPSSRMKNFDSGPGFNYSPLNYHIMSKLVEISIGDRKYSFRNRYGNSNHGFNHFTEVYLNGCCIGKNRCHYINRTWESYTYQSVMTQAVENLIAEVKSAILSMERKSTGTTRLKASRKEELFSQSVRIAEYNLLLLELHNRSENSGLGVLAGVMAMGDILCNNQQEANDWKLRMMKAGTPTGSLIMPDDWDTLTEEEKAKRLNGCINALK
jgi:hypothetical protein